jgi:hypothetical protein
MKIHVSSFLILEFSQHVQRCLSFDQSQLIEEYWNKKNHAQATNFWTRTFKIWIEKCKIHVKKDFKVVTL